MSSFQSETSAFNAGRVVAIVVNFVFSLEFGGMVFLSVLFQQYSKPIQLS